MTRVVNINVPPSRILRDFPGNEVTQMQIQSFHKVGTCKESGDKEAFLLEFAINNFTVKIWG